MSEAPRNQNLAVRTTTVLIDFMHGGLLMAGLILTLIMAGLAAGNPQVIEGARALRRELAPAPSPTPVAAPQATTANRLGSEMRAVLESVSKRYRVSATALEPVFATVQATSRELKIDPLLIVAVIAVESGFNPLSESVMGAQGLMQVVPRFHQDKLPVRNDRLALFDPEVNVGIGARILKDSISRMGDLSAGLQQFAGALDDPDASYASKVMAERQKLEAAGRRGRAPVAVASAAP